MSAQRARRVGAAVLSLAVSGLGGCVEDAYQAWLGRHPAGGDAGGADGGGSDGCAPDGGRADGGAMDGGSFDGGCPSGCAPDWPTFLACGPRGVTLCLPSTNGFTGVVGRAAFHGPASGFSESSLAFVDDGGTMAWVGVAGTGGVRILGNTSLAQAPSGLVVDDEHDANGSTECVDAFLSNGPAMLGSYLYACGGSVGSGLLDAPAPFTGLSWLPSQGGQLLSFAGAFGAAHSLLAYPESTPGSTSAAFAVDADRVQGLTGVQGDAGCSMDFGEWWLVSPPDGGLVAVPACNSGVVLPVVPPGGLVVSANVRMTAEPPLGCSVPTVAAVVGWDGGALFAFPVLYDLSTAGPVAWLDAGVAQVSGLEISSWGNPAAIRAAFLDPAGHPHVADLDMAALRWTVGAREPPGAPVTAQFVAPLYPDMLLTVESGQVEVRYLP